MNPRHHPKSHHPPSRHVAGRAIDELTYRRPEPRVTGRPTSARSAVFATRRQRATIACVTTAITLIAGCTSHDPAVKLPPAAGTPPTSPPAPATTAASPSAKPAEETVKAAYIAFWDASERAVRVPAQQIKSALQGHSTPSYMRFQVQQISAMHARHQEPWGHVIRHVQRVEVNGQEATVHDCQDASAAGLADDRTHVLIAGTRGTKQRNLVAYLTLGGEGQWLVNSLRQFKKPC